MGDFTTGKQNTLPGNLLPSHDDITKQSPMQNGTPMSAPTSDAPDVMWGPQVREGRDDSSLKWETLKSKLDLVGGKIFFKHDNGRIIIVDSNGNPIMNTLVYKN